jgi:hypothetical protein
MSSENHQDHDKEDSLADDPPSNNNNTTTTSSSSSSTRSWEASLCALLEYKYLHGDCNVPQHYADDYALGMWVTRQRRIKQQLTLQQLRILQAIHFDWSPLDTQWNNMYERLAAYKQLHGHCRVSIQADAELKRWITTQKYNETHGRLDPERKAKLNALHVEWAKKRQEKKIVPQWEERWQEQYKKLIHYKAKHGHTVVPTVNNNNNNNDDPEQLGTLGEWVKNQRKLNQKNALRADRKALLDDIDFTWKVCPVLAQKRRFHNNNNKNNNNNSTDTTTNASAAAAAGGETTKQRATKRRKTATAALDHAQAYLLPSYPLPPPANMQQQQQQQLHTQDI